MYQMFPETTLRDMDLDGEPVLVQIRISEVEMMRLVRQAAKNKTRRSHDGPVTVTLLPRPKAKLKV